MAILPKECDANFSCPQGQICHPDLQRCTTEEPEISSLFLALHLEENGVPRLYTTVLPTSILTSDDGPFVLDVPDSVLIQGNVLYEGPQGPIRSGSVVIKPKLPAWPTLPRLSIRTANATPSFQVRLTPHEDYEFQVHSDELSAPMFEVVQSFDPTEVATLNLNLPSGEALHIIPFRVVNTDGDSLKGVQLSLLDLDGHMISGHAKSSEDGEAQLFAKDGAGPFTLRIQDIPDVPGGSWSIQLEADLNDITEAFEIEVPVERHTKIDPENNNEVTTTGELRATVLALNGENQEALAGARVLVTRLSPGVNQTQFASSDATGSAHFQNLQPGLIMVTAVPPSGSAFGLSTRAAWITANTIESLELVARPRPRILGTVRKSNGAVANGYSVESASSFIFETLNGQKVMMLERTETDPAGAYGLFSNLGAQKMLILPPQGSGKPPGSASFFVEPQVGKASLEINVDLPPPFVREIIFKRTDGSTIENLQIEMIWIDENAPNGYIHHFGATNRFGEWILALPGKITNEESDR